MTMRFKRYGKTYQLRIESAQDLEHVLDLDEALWVATSAPISAFRCDPKLVESINTDGSGRINTDEVRAAVRWMLDVLADRTLPGNTAEPLPLDAINGDSPEGKQLIDSAREVLAGAGDPDAASVSLEQVRGFLVRLREQPLNGDGIVVPAAADGEVRQLIMDVLDCTGSAEDAGGDPGVDEARLDAFVTAARGLLEWREAGSGDNADSLVPFGAATPGIYEHYAAVVEPVDAFFHACRVLKFDDQTAGHFKTAAISGADATDGNALDAWLQTRPLARVNAEGQLPLAASAINPFYTTQMENLRTEVLPRILGDCPETLDEAGWDKVREALQPYADYMGAKQGASVEKLPPARLDAYRDGTLADAVRRLIAEDKRISKVRVGVQALERLLLYRAHLLRLANNFVNFAELYNVEDRALFEIGSAVVDGRWFNLAFKVEDVALHQGVAKGSNIFTLYLEIEGLDGAKPFTVAVPAMAGSKGNLQVGKRGVFFDITGRERNARVTQIIANPISVREALCAPFVRLWAFLLGKIESMSATSEQELQKQTDSMLKAPPAGAAQDPAGKGQFGSAGMLMGLSVSVAAVGSAFAFITKTLASLNKGQIFLGILGAALVVMVPVSLIAVLKLRRQDLSALLEGCGWAINARMRPTRAQRRQFTRAPRFPAGAEGTPTRRLLYALLAIAGILALILLLQRVG